MTVFISYSSVDGAAVGALARNLEASGKRVWFDKEIHGGEAWWGAILKQIRDSSVFLFALSANSLESEPCSLECDYARALGIAILPVEIGDIPPEERRNHAVYNEQIVDYRNPTAESAIQLVRAVNEREAERKPLPDPLPPEPPIPYEYLARLGPVIRGSAPIGYAEQQSLFTQLRDALRRERNESVRESTRKLLIALRDRPDATRAVMSDIDALLAEGAKGAGHAAGAAAAGVAVAGAAAVGAAAAGAGSADGTDGAVPSSGEVDAGGGVAREPEQPATTPAAPESREPVPPPWRPPEPAVPAAAAFAAAATPPAGAGGSPPPVPTPPGYGAPGYGAGGYPGMPPGQGPPPGQYGAAQYGPPGGPPPGGRQPGSGRRLGIILGSIAAAVVVIVVIAVVALWPRGGPAPTPTPIAETQTPTPTPTGDPVECWDDTEAAAADQCTAFTGANALYYAFSPMDGPDGTPPDCTEELPNEDVGEGALFVYSCTWADLPGTLVQLVEWDDTPQGVQQAWLDRVEWDEEFNWTFDDEQIGVTWERATTLEDTGSNVWWWAAAYDEIPMSLDIFASSSQDGTAETVQAAWDRLLPLSVEEIETLAPLAQ